MVLFYHFIQYYAVLKEITLLSMPLKVADAKGLRVVIETILLVVL